MGKWRQQNKGAQGWSYWQGSWASASPGRGQGQWGKDEAPQTGSGIPAYDAKRTTTAASATTNGQPDHGHDPAQGLVQGLQKAVNQARKAEARVKRIMADKKERQLQWQSWEAELRQTFAREKNRYVTAVAKLDADMQEALKNQDEARAALRDAACGTQPAPMAVCTSATNEEFDALVRDDGWDPADLDAGQDAVLRRALEASLQLQPAHGRANEAPAALRPPPPSSVVTQRTIPTGADGAAPAPAVADAALGASSRLRPFPPAMRPIPGQELASFGTAASLDTSHDPYVPALHKQAMPPGAASPVNGAPKTPKIRQGVKDQARPSGPIHAERAFAGIQENFAEKRAALMAELGGGAGVQNFLIHDDDTGQDGGMDWSRG